MNSTILSQIRGDDVERGRRHNDDDSPREAHVHQTKEAEGDGRKQAQLLGDGRLVHVVDAKQPNGSGNEVSVRYLRVLFNHRERVGEGEGADGHQKGRLLDCFGSLDGRDEILKEGCLSRASAPSHEETSAPDDVVAGPVLPQRVAHGSHDLLDVFRVVIAVRDFSRRRCGEVECRALGDAHLLAGKRGNASLQITSV